MTGSLKTTPPLLKISKYDPLLKIIVGYAGYNFYSPFAKILKKITNIFGFFKQNFEFFLKLILATPVIITYQCKKLTLFSKYTFPLSNNTHFLHCDACLKSLSCVKQAWKTQVFKVSANRMWQQCFIQIVFVGCVHTKRTSFLQKP
jgi:hypothetical protein